MLRSCREKGNPTEQFPVREPHGCPTSPPAPAATTQRLGAARGPFWGVSGAGKEESFPVPDLSHPFLQRPQQSLDPTLRISCDLGKCLTQKDRLWTEKRRERRTLGCCRGSLLSGARLRVRILSTASRCLMPDGGHTQHGFARRDKSTRLTPPKTEESRWR